MYHESFPAVDVTHRSNHTQTRSSLCNIGQAQHIKHSMPCTEVSSSSFFQLIHNLKIPNHICPNSIVKNHRHAVSQAAQKLLVQAEEQQ